LEDVIVIDFIIRRSRSVDGSSEIKDNFENCLRQTSIKKTSEELFKFCFYLLGKLRILSSSVFHENSFDEDDIISALDVRIVNNLYSNKKFICNS
jgi:hypothetical protein